ncbi:MAG: thioredoxin domain-containing protein [Bdellovibrionaceae bacterium]|nr:thioredoxin domain-containing protein [Bdellovibrionales bacterium]MCB9254403.1 thioredoxin domain-containing protein [Pseudobdellovibrionaceae bacterium]
MAKPSKTHKNLLIHETSPYLLQHAHNPVNWYPWGEEAKAKARRENKPIFLSVGYSACHWCHVMEKESFEDEATAEILNAHFVSVKVDREERPDVDAVYMSAVQAMTRHGGWPMSVFLTPELKPFYGGTYFPPNDRGGMPSFKKVLLGVASAWKNRKQEVLASAEEFTGALKALTEGQLGIGEEPKGDLLREAFENLRVHFDDVHGGFGRAPKFFHTMDLRVCLRAHKVFKVERALNMVTDTLDKISVAGIYDHLGGGFHRYSTDAAWFAPHFEKMLYDNALLAVLFTEAFQVTKEIRYARMVHEILEYVSREMKGPSGEFYSTQDADSEGIEGKFYTWKKNEILAVLGTEDGERFCELYHVIEGGNWENTNILYPGDVGALLEKWDWDITTLERKRSSWREQLLEQRERRPKPLRDEKVLVSWNSLMITAFAKAYQVFGDETYLESARSCAAFIREKLWDEEKLSLLHCYKDGQSRFQAYLDDHAYLMEALVSLYESDFSMEWVRWAERLGERVLEDFWDPTTASFYFTGKQHEALVAKTRDYQDGATPAASAVLTTAFLRLGRLLSRADFEEKALGSLKLFEPLMREHPMAAGQWLIALDLSTHSPSEAVVTEGEDRETHLGTLRESFVPGLLVVDSHSPLEIAQSKPAVNGRSTIYICKGKTCEPPITDGTVLKTRCQTL